MHRLPSLSLALSLVACSNLLDLGSSRHDTDGPGSPGQDAGAEAHASPDGTQNPDSGTEPDGGAIDCSGVDPTMIEVFRSPGNEGFNVSGLASDGVHLYIAGYGPSVMPSGNGSGIVQPSASNKMATASLLRVPVTGGAREVLEYQRLGDAARSVAIDAQNVYWGQDTMLFQPKSGGATTEIGGASTWGSPQTVTTNGTGNVFWATWYGGMGSQTSPATAIGAKVTSATSASTFQMGTSDADGATWITSDSTTVYWFAGASTHELRSAPIGGSDPTSHKVLTNKIDQTYALTTDDQFVWGASNDSVWKVPKQGGDPVVVATPATGRSFRTVGVTATAVYFGDDQTPTTTGGPVVKGHLFRAGKDGSNVTAISPDQELSMELTVDACRVYWTAFDWVGNPGYETVIYARGL